jgi:hypothetical protein
VISIANAESTTKYVNKGPKLKIAITFDGDVRFQKLDYRWKALNLSFRSAVESPKMEITIKSYGDLSWSSDPLCSRSVGLYAIDLNDLKT